MRLLTLIFLSFFVFKSTACDENFLPGFKDWEYTKNYPELEVKDLLPKAFIKQVEEAQGPIVLNMEYKYGTDLSFSLSTSEYKKFIYWTFQKNPTNANSIIIESLRLENPLVVKGSEELHHGQLNKGLPSEVFRYARNQIFELIKASKKTVLTSKSSQNYTVFMLYQKLVGMSPKTEQGKEFAQLLDRFYSFGRKNLPEDLKFNSLNEYAFVLGDYYASSVSAPAKAFWNNYLSTGEVASEIELLFDNEEVIGFIFRGAPEGYTKVHFVYSKHPNRPIIEFREAMRVPGLTELERVLE
ncbi:MAG: hypothetical protein ACOYL6_08870 [Bacteriovoracaceae bacterium]